MKKLIVHIGYPKTATTTLQVNFLKGLKKLGKIEYLNHLPKTSNNKNDIFCRESIKCIMGLCPPKKKYQIEAKNFKKIEKEITVISNENISHFSGNPPKLNFKYASIGNAERIKKLISPYFNKTEIIITIRAHESIIPSYYTEYYSSIRTDTPNFDNIGSWVKYLCQFRGEDKYLLFNYYAMYTSYAEFFGHKNVHVLLFEDIKHDKRAFYKKIGKIFDVEENFVKKIFEKRAYNVTKKHSSSSTKTDELNLYEIISYNLKKILKKVDERRSKLLIQYLKRITPFEFFNRISFGGKKIRNLKPKEIEMIHEKFDPSNKKLAKKINLSESKLIYYKYLQS